MQRRGNRVFRPWPGRDAQVPQVRNLEEARGRTDLGNPDASMGILGGRDHPGLSVQKRVHRRRDVFLDEPRRPGRMPTHVGAFLYRDFARMPRVRDHETLPASGTGTVWSMRDPRGKDGF